MAAIEIDSLRKTFPLPGGGEVVAVDDISLDIRDGEFFTLVGPSGCGKTTTLRCIAGLERPTSGSIRFAGGDVTDVPPERRDLAMMFQNIALYPHMKIKENIAYPLKVRNVPTADRYAEAERAAEIMQIPELLEKKPAELSGGQRQRAALARTIVQDPVAFLMDEPLSDLDAKLKIEIRKEIQRVHQRVEKPTVYVTHDQSEAMTMSDRIAVLIDGEVAQVGTPDELYNRPNSDFVAEFIGTPSMNFLEGTIDSLDDQSCRVRAHDEVIEFDIDYLEREPTGSGVRIGFRPEAVEVVDDAGDFDGEVFLRERIGDRILASIDGPEGEIRVTVSEEHPVKEGSRVSLSVDRGGIYLFDVDTGDLVTRGASEASHATPP
jgi:multiple sugar transport system ATP-binding protein